VYVRVYVYMLFVCLITIIIVIVYHYYYSYSICMNIINSIINHCALLLQYVKDVVADSPFDRSVVQFVNRIFNK